MVFSQRKKLLITGLFLSTLFLIFLFPLTAGAQGTCNFPPCKGGLVPCGRQCDDPDTEICEACPCTICHFFVLVKRVIDFLVKNIIFPVLVIVVAIGGTILLTSAGNEAKVKEGKSILTSAVIGMVLALAGWLIVNTLVFFLTGEQKGGVATIFTQPWNKIDCPLECKIGGDLTLCGDGIVQVQVFEECDPKESVADCVARTRLSDSKCQKLLGNCGSDCKLKKTELCTDDPNKSKIGLGCWLSDNPADRPRYCQRGKFECDTKIDSPTFGKVACLDVFDSPVYDECCKDGGSALPAMGLDIRKIPATAFCHFNKFCMPFPEPGGSYACDFSSCATAVTCDEICKSGGKVCVGVGLRDVANYHCVSIKHNLSPSVTCDHVTDANCQQTANLRANDCRKKFATTGELTHYASCLECFDFNGDGVPEPYPSSVGQTNCYCK
jgi:hypothetical protein